MAGIALAKSPFGNKIIFFFLLCWTILNAVQAYTLELQGDEAYYWLYSKYLSWGYFDHPPMIAFFIRFGDSLLHNELGLRMLTILASSASVYLLWIILKKYAVDAIAFVSVVSGIFIFHIYGFTTTPDVPLFFFTVLFYFFYQQYIENDNWLLAFLIGLTVACLLYSKYNGILLIIFTLASNIQLLRRKSFWFIFLLAIALYIPHIMWQVQHNYPSVNYHLFERSARRYKFIDTFSYLPAQLLMAGPLIGWFLFYSAFKAKVKDRFIRCLLVNCAGTLFFFLVSSFKGEVQPQWTFILYAPLVMLVLIRFKQSGAIPKWFFPLAAVNLTIILAVRIIIIAGFGFARTYGHLKSYYGFKDWAFLVKQKAGNSYVVMSEGFQNPSKYDYYNNNLKCFGYDPWNYRHTQFDIWPLEDSLQHKRVYYLNYFPVKGITTDSLKVAAGTWYGGWIDDFRTYQKVVFTFEDNEISASPGERMMLPLKMLNPYSHAISFDDNGYLHPVSLQAIVLSGNEVSNIQEAGADFKNIKLQSGESADYTFTFKAPLQKGHYDLLFSLQTDPFPGSKNSRIINLAVK